MQEQNEQNYNFDYYRTKTDVVITEMADMSEADMESKNSPHQNGNGHQGEKYFVEEPSPYDYIFEPDHCGKETSQNRETKMSEDETDSEDSKDKFTHARMVRETDGFLEYEYKSYTYNRNALTPDLNYFFNDHLNGIIRGISLVKWPQIGFGFTLAQQPISNEESFIYVDKIENDSPAEFCLQSGDIIIEIDELEPDKFANMNDLNKYLSDRENVHLMVIHESKYMRLKSENEELLKNYNTNCEDIVIVSWNNHKIEQNI